MLATALALQAWGDFLIWAMMLGVLAWLLWYFSRQRRYLEALFSRPDEETLRRLQELTRNRGWMVCYLWGLLTLTIITYDLRYPTQEPPAAPPVPGPAPASVAPPPASTPALSEVQREIEIDKIKTYFEDAFVSYYYLHKCRAARPEDNARLYQALWNYLATFDATQNAPQIMSAAQGSFEVIYSRTGCDSKTLEPIRQRFDTFMQALPGPAPAGR
jgi:hypothetical protein